MEEIFSQIAREENGKYSADDYNYAGSNGVRTPHSKYLLNIKYKGNKIIIQNELGIQSYGVMQMSFKVSQPVANFSIETKNHFLSLFSKKKETFKVKSENLSLVDFIELNKNFLLLKEIAKKTKFEPFIEGTVKNDYYSITVEYSLLFTERRDVLRPLINFYKELMDYLDR